MNDNVTDRSSNDETVDQGGTMTAVPSAGALSATRILGLEPLAFEGQFDPSRDLQVIIRRLRLLDEQHPDLNIGERMRTALQSTEPVASTKAIIGIVNDHWEQLDLSAPIDLE